MLGCPDETVPFVKRSRFVIDSIDHDKTCRSDLSGGDGLPQCLSEQDCAKTRSLRVQSALA